MKSSLFRVDGKDLVRGLLITILTALLTALAKAIEVEGLSFTWEDIKTILTLSIASGVAYLAKNLATNSDDKMLKKEP